MSIPLDAPVPLRLTANHLLFERGDKIHLLDTGTPWTIDAPASVGDALGTSIDTLVGCDEIAKAPLTIDWPARELRTGDVGALTDVVVPLGRALFGIPTIEIEGPSGRAMGIFDTGAALSYAPAPAVAGSPFVRRTKDFLPGYGTFEVEVHSLPVLVGGLALELECAVLPPALGAALALIAPDGWIIGTGLLANRVSTIDLANGALRLSAAQSAHEPTAEDRDRSRALGSTELHGPEGESVEESSLALRVRYDVDDRAARGGLTIRALIDVEYAGASAPAPTTVRVAFVLDRSGSMRGSKIESMRRATLAAVRRLPAASRYSVVVFDSRVEVLHSFREVNEENLRQLERELLELTDRGTTALGDGWQAGLEQLAAQADLLPRRILLLTDGHANVGERSPSRLAEWCAEARAAGITTSTIGVGSGYDEDLLRGMAVAGGGSTWYIPDPALAEEVMGQEIQAMGTITLRDAILEWKGSGSARLRRVHGVLGPVENESSRAMADLGDLYTSHPRRVLLEFDLPPEGPRPRSEVPLGTVRLEGRSADGLRRVTVDTPLSWNPHAPLDDEARVAYLRFMLADARRRAVAANDDGDSRRAADILAAALEEVARERTGMREALREDLRDAERVRRRLQRGRLDSASRKHTLQKFDNVATSKMAYDALLQLTDERRIT